MQVQSRADHLSSDTGALLLREIMERTGIVEWMTERLVDPRNPHTVSYPLADLLQTNLLLLGQGWRDQDDAERLRDDPSFCVATDSHRGTASWGRTARCPRSRRCLVVRWPAVCGEYSISWATASNIWTTDHPTNGYRYIE